MKKLIALILSCNILVAANLSFESNLDGWTGLGKYETITTKLDRQAKSGTKEALISASADKGAADFSKESEKDKYIELFNASTFLTKPELSPKTISTISQVLSFVGATKLQIDVNTYRVAGGKGYGGVTLKNYTTGESLFYSVGQVENATPLHSTGNWDFEAGWRTATFNLEAGDWELTAGLFSYDKDLPVAIAIDNIRSSIDAEMISVEEPIDGKGQVIGGAIMLVALLFMKKNQ